VPLARHCLDRPLASERESPADDRKDSFVSTEESDLDELEQARSAVIPHERGTSTTRMGVVLSRRSMICTAIERERLTLPELI
jgi:hypothetical protein